MDKRYTRGIRQCNNFDSTGSCRHGNDCTYRHGQQDSRDVAALRDAREKRDQHGVNGSTFFPGFIQCNSFASGYCRHANDCTFKHGQNDSRDMATLLDARKAREALPKGAKEQAPSPPKDFLRFLPPAPTDPLPFIDLSVDIPQTPEEQHEEQKPIQYQRLMASIQLKQVKDQNKAFTVAFAVYPRPGCKLSYEVLSKSHFDAYITTSLWNQITSNSSPDARYFCSEDMCGVELCPDPSHYKLPLFSNKPTFNRMQSQEMGIASVILTNLGDCLDEPEHPVWVSVVDWQSLTKSTSQPAIKSDAIEDDAQQEQKFYASLAPLKVFSASDLKLTSIAVRDPSVPYEDRHPTFVHWSDFINNNPFVWPVIHSRSPDVTSKHLMELASLFQDFPEIAHCFEFASTKKFGHKEFVLDRDPNEVAEASFISAIWQITDLFFRGDKVGIIYNRVLTGYSCFCIWREGVNVRLWTFANRHRHIWMTRRGARFKPASMLLLQFVARNVYRKTDHGSDKYDGVTYPKWGDHWPIFLNRHYVNTLKHNRIYKHAHVSLIRYHAIFLKYILQLAFVKGCFSSWDLKVDPHPAFDALYFFLGPYGVWGNDGRPQKEKIEHPYCIFPNNLSGPRKQAATGSRIFSPNWPFRINAVVPSDACLRIFVQYAMDWVVTYKTTEFPLL